MACRLLGLVTAAAMAVVATACDQAPPSAPQDGPSLTKTPPPGSFPCVFTGNPSLASAINGYFTLAADKKKANDFAATMQALFIGADPYAGARDAGFDLLALVGTVSRQGTGSSPDAGAFVARQTIQCIFNVNAALGQGQDFEGWPTDNHFDYASSLTYTTGGAWFVRGDPTKDPQTAPAIGTIATQNTTADPAKGNLSGIGPGTSTWHDLLGSTPRVLIYGEPVGTGLGPTGYDWKLLPRKTTFVPFAVVALCQGFNREFLSADMVHQNGVGVLGFTGAETLCGTSMLPVPVALLDAEWGRFALVGRLVRAADRFFALEPLHAATVATTIGGTLRGATKDEFDALNVPTVQLDMTNPPAQIKVNTQRFSISVVVSTPPEPVGGIEVTLSVTNNNGATNIFEITPAALASYTGCSLADNPAPPAAPWVVPAKETTLATVSQDGLTASTVAVWSNNLCIDKTGTGTIVATSVAVGNPNAGKGTDVSARTNVKP